MLMVHTIGGVVTPAQSLLNVVPDGGPWIVEASVQNQDIGFVHVGQEAEIKVAAFDFTRYGAINGTVVSHSPDVDGQAPYQPPQDDGYTQSNTSSMPQQLQTNANATQRQAPEYIADILLSRDELETSQGVAQLEPGVTADVKTGRRRVISYRLSPFTHRVEEAGHERQFPIEKWQV